MAVIIPAILTADESANHTNLLKAEHVAEIIQVDVIDGKFAENVTVSSDVIKKYISSANLEIQLLVEYPQNYIDDLIKLDHIFRIIVPFEGRGGIPEAIYHIKNHQKQAGLSINPETPVSAILHFLDDIDLLVLLAVKPGFSGQEFQEPVLNKVSEIKKLNPAAAVEIDGGVNLGNVQKIAATGCDFLAVNSALYKTPDFRIAYEKLAKIASNPQSNISRYN